MQAASDDAYRERIRTLLGPDAFARFEAHFDTLQTRHDLQGAFRRVAMLTDPLTPAQREGLVAQRHAARTGGEAPLPPVALTPAQQAIFADWEADELVQKKMTELSRRKSGPFRLTPIYLRAGSSGPGPYRL